jgi:quercetin dioxygenase-like cupin family protein
MKKNYLFLFVLIIMMICVGCNNSNDTNKQNLSNDSIKLNDKKTQLTIDPVIVSPGIFKTLLENDNVRVVQYSLEPGEKDNWHTHPPKSTYVVSGGKLKVYLENGEAIIANEISGTASWMDYVGKHYVENIGTTTVTIVFTEIK